MRKAALILLIFLIPVAAIVFVVIYSRITAVKPPPAAAISVWGIYDPKAIQEVTAAYRAAHPYATITYSQVTRENLKNRAVEAWALGTGPDILMIPAVELRDYLPFIQPAPASSVSYIYTRTKQFGIKDELKITKQVVAGPTATSVRQDFVDTVLNDGVINGQVYGLPLTMDSLVLYSNRKLLSQARVAYPAKTWPEIVQHVPSLTLFDSKEQLVQSGIALGTENNVNHAEDILSLLILQNGGSVTAGLSVTLDQSTTNLQATDFYTDFAKPTKVVYSWNDQQKDALTAFAEGRVTYYIGYTSDEASIRERGAGLQFEITEIPQVNLQRPVSIADYDLFVVSNRAKSPAVTWNFLQNLTSKEGATMVLNQTLQTPARRDLIQTLLANTDTTIRAKVSQALIANTWYTGSNANRARTIMRDLIKTVRTGGGATTELLSSTAQQLRLIQK